MPFLGANTLIIIYLYETFFKNGNCNRRSRCYLLVLQNHAPGLTLTLWTPGQPQVASTGSHSLLAVYW